VDEVPKVIKLLSEGIEIQVNISEESLKKYSNFYTTIPYF